MYGFETLPQNWPKRRKITDAIRQVVDVGMLGFVKNRLSPLHHAGDI